MQFQNNYASYYDYIYQDKDYLAECKYLINVLSNHYKKKVSSILDIACGTGSHVASLAKLGLQVVGSDISTDMISIAKTKKISESNPEYINKDMRSLGSIGKFDAAICMFAALNYITDYNDLEKVLKGVADNLKPGGLFFCDVWNGLAVLARRPSSRVKYVKRQGMLLIRSSESILDPARHLCEVNFKLTVFKKGLNEPLSYEETHKLRFYFAEELKYIFSKNRFEIIDVHPFMEPKKSISEDEWNMGIIAQKL